MEYVLWGAFFFCRFCLRKKNKKNCKSTSSMCYKKAKV
ncbi:hypothetical protein LEP1GSC061_1363 [Leptospira wolffii serovar Khorat str. Khorat-H2]|nr:hypothetical protein LEP1GSC061_1363 [Leptospira wolffii serovar Khorat str. Khorat-H2]